MFEWDEDKRQRNIKEHRVDFRVAVRIFNNPVIESTDEREEYEETRYRPLGHDEQQYYMVAYTCLVGPEPTFVLSTAISITWGIVNLMALGLIVA